MFRRVILKGILGRKARLFITSIAVILGTAFLSGTSVFSATLNRTFDNLFQDVFKNIDGYVRSTEVVEGEFGLQERTRIPLEMVEKVRQVPGVADVSPDIQAFARIIAKDGKPLGSEGNGPPTFGSVGEDRGASVHGVLFLLLATCCYAFTSILSREMQLKHGTLAVLLWQELFALLFSLPLGLPAFADSEFAWSALLALLVLGSLGTGLAYVLYGMLMVRAGAVRGVIGVFFTPIVATFLGVILRDEKVTVLAVIGMLVVICGAWLTSRPDTAVPVRSAG